VHIFSADYLEDVLQATRTSAKIHAMNYATKCVIKVKWEIFFLWQIKFNEPALQRGYWTDSQKTALYLII